MKTRNCLSILLVIFLLSCAEKKPVTPQPSPPIPGPFSASVMSADHEKFEDTVLRKVDSACADTWCEGSFGFEFGYFSCDDFRDDTCVLLFSMQRYQQARVKETKDYTAMLGLNPIECQCFINGLYTPEYVLTTDGELQQEFGEKLTECINALEERIGK